MLPDYQQLIMNVAFSYNTISSIKLFLYLNTYKNALLAFQLEEAKIVSLSGCSKYISF